MTDFYAQVHGLLPNGEAWSTGRHITSGRSLPTLLSVWGAAWDAAWTDGTHGLDAIYPAAMTVATYTVAQLDGFMRELAKQSLPTTQFGSDANEALPASSAIVVTWRSSTDIRRTARGHQELPGPSNDKVLNDKLTSAVQTRVSAAMNAIKASITSDGSTFYVFPKTLSFGGVPAFTKTVTDVVTCRDKLGTQKKRFRKEPATYV
jgi:hypothetical protein